MRGRASFVALLACQEAEKGKTLTSVRLSAYSVHVDGKYHMDTLLSDHV